MKFFIQLQVRLLLEKAIEKPYLTRTSEFSIKNGVICVPVFCRAGLISEVLMRKKEMEILAHLKNIIILDCDKEALYKKVKLNNT